MSYFFVSKKIVLTDQKLNCNCRKMIMRQLYFRMKCDEWSILPVTDVALSSKLKHFGMLNGAFMGQWLLLVIINRLLE